MRRGLLQVAAIAAMLVMSLTPADAQGLLQQLFGLGSPPPQQPAVAAPVMLTPGGRPYTLPAYGNHGAFMSRKPLADTEDSEQRSSGGYRTICVRTCDGFFFPISNSTSKKSLYRDNMKCRAQCGDDARMFYLPARTTDIDGAVDLQGRQYGRLNTAYVYRKTLVAGCQCKPDPWSETELARHKQYAEAEIEAKQPSGAITADGSDTATAVKGAEPPQGTDAQKVAEDLSQKPRTNPWKTTTTRATPKLVQPSPRPVAQQASASGTGLFGSGMGLGGGQLTWPGDTPRRP